MPNIIFFMLDQLSAKWLEAAMGGVCATPNFDRLRARGTTFTNAISSNPLCTPARATLATGLTSRQHGALQNGYCLDPSIPTFMRALQGGGWRTGAFGKVHLHPQAAGGDDRVRDRGFDVAHITEDPRSGEWLEWIEREHPAHYEAALATIWGWSHPRFRQYGPGKIDLGERIRRLRESFDWTSPEVPDATQLFYALPFPEPLSQSAWITRQAIEFLRQTDPAAPLYAHVSYVQPHAPFCAPAECFADVDPARIPEPIDPTWIDDPLRPAGFCDDHRIFPERPAHWRQLRHCYFADIVHLDRQLGLLTDAIAQAGRAENTYLILLADHGEMLLDHGFRGKGNRHYDACVRVPLIVAGPGIAAGAACERFVQLEDLFPTVLEMAGLAPPAAKVAGRNLKEHPDVLPGRSLLPLCRGESPEAWRDDAYVESYSDVTNALPIHWARTVRTARYRYTCYAAGGGEQLFDLSADPDETVNLAAAASHRRVRRDLRDRLMERIILQDYPHPPRGLFAHGAS